MDTTLTNDSSGLIRNWSSGEIPPELLQEDVARISSVGEIGPTEEKSRFYRNVLKLLKGNHETVFNCKWSKQKFIDYSQTWANDHLRIATTCQQRPQFWGPEGGRCT